jgi:hypothetical protein
MKNVHSILNCRKPLFGRPNHGCQTVNRGRSFARPTIPVLIIGVTVVFAPLAALAREHPDQSQQIIGKWDLNPSLRSLRDGRGMTLEFRADGTFLLMSDIEMQARYHLNDNHLTTSAWNAAKAKYVVDREFEFRFEGNGLVERDLKSLYEIRLNRAEGEPVPTTNTILGEWYSENYPGATRDLPLALPLRSPAFVEYGRKGELYFRSTPLATKRGRFEFAGRELVTRLGGEAPFRRKIHVSHDRLDIKISKGDKIELPFRRVTRPSTDRQGPLN